MMLTVTSQASKRSFMLKREIVLEKLDGNQTMSGIIIQRLNSAPDGTVDVIYLSDNCIEGLNWPHQMYVVARLSRVKYSSFLY